MCREKKIHWLSAPWAFSQFLLHPTPTSAKKLRPILANLLLYFSLKNRFSHTQRIKFNWEDLLKLQLNESNRNVTRLIRKAQLRLKLLWVDKLAYKYKNKSSFLRIKLKYFLRKISNEAWGQHVMQQDTRTMLYRKTFQTFATSLLASAHESAYSLVVIWEAKPLIIHPTADIDELANMLDIASYNDLHNLQFVFVSENFHSH